MAVKSSSVVLLHFIYIFNLLFCRQDLHQAILLARLENVTAFWSYQLKKKNPCHFFPMLPVCFFVFCLFVFHCLCFWGRLNHSDWVFSPCPHSLVCCNPKPKKGFFPSGRTCSPVSPSQAAAAANQLTAAPQHLLPFDSRPFFIWHTLDRKRRKRRKKQQQPIYTLTDKHTHKRFRRTTCSEHNSATVVASWLMSHGI